MLRDCEISFVTLSFTSFLEYMRVVNIDLRDLDEEAFF